MSNQSLSTGTVLSQQFRDARGRSFVPPLSGTLCVLAGVSNAGKTALGLSDPDNLVIAFEPSPTPLKPKGILWPGKGDSGERIDLDGKVITDWNWQRVIKMRDTLLQMAAAKDPNRPKTIFLDTADEALELLKPFAAECLLPSSHPNRVWRSVHGQQGYPFLYENFTKLALALHAAGYGVFINIHIGRKKVEMGVDSAGEKSFTTKDGIVLLTESFYQSLYRKADLVLIMSKGEETFDDVVKEKMPDGSTRDKRITKKQMVYRVSDTDIENTSAKSRVKKLGSVVIPEENGFAALAARYEEVRKEMIQ